MSEILAGIVIEGLTRGLDASSLRQQVYAHNLANVNTPSFKRSEVQFKDVFKEAVSADKLQMVNTAPGHLRRTEEESDGIKVVTDQTTSMRTDGNNVDVDKEMSELAINQLYYNALSRQLSSRISMLSYVITEGRG